MKRLTALLAAIALGCLNDGGGDEAVSGPGGILPLPPPDASDALFRDDEFNDVRITMDAGDWRSIIEDTRGDAWREARVAWKDVVLDRVAARPAGQFSRFPGNPKQSIKLKFNEFVPGQKLMGLKRLKLDGMVADDSMLVERLVYAIHRARLPAAPRAVHCRLFVNGEYRGVYLMEESVDSAFVEHRFPGPQGYLYRILLGGGYAWRGDDPSSYMPEPWLPQTRELDGDHRVIVHFLEALHADRSRFGQIADLTTLIDFLTVEVAMAYEDGLTGIYGPHNHYQYFHPATGRFFIIPWDVGGGWDDESRDIFMNFDSNPLSALVASDPELRRRYLERLADLMETEWRPEALGPRIDAIHRQIREAAHADPYKNRSNADFDSAPAALKRFVEKRREYVRSRL